MLYQKIGTSGEMDLHLALRMLEILDIRKSKNFNTNLFRPNEDPEEVHSVETILKDIIDVSFSYCLNRVVWVR
jgi:hypothetical protein